MERVRGSSPTGISVSTVKVIALSRVIESLSGLTAATSVPSGDTATAEADTGRLSNTVEVECTVEMDCGSETVAEAFSV